MKDLDTQLKLFEDLTGDGGAVEAEVPVDVSKRKLATTAAKGRDRTPVFLNPDRQEDGGIGIAGLRRAWQEKAWEHAHIQPECVLVNEVRITERATRLDELANPNHQLMDSRVADCKMKKSRSRSKRIVKIGRRFSPSVWIHEIEYRRLRPDIHD
jgi:hypothetical protein